MKKFNYLLASCISIGVFFASCNSSFEDRSIDSEKTEVDLTSEISLLTTSEATTKNVLLPISIGTEEDNGRVVVTFMQTSRPYFLDMQSKNSASCVSLINRAIKEHLSLEISVLEGTTEITSIKLVNGLLQKSIQNKLILNPELEVKTRAVSVIPSEAVLNALYQKIVNQSCGVASSGCIPFRYPVDGCFARAHAVRRILLNNGYDCQKIFLYGNLAAKNGCCVTWGYHVAPLVDVSTSSGTVTRVLDPSLFSSPVSIDVWVNGCLNASCWSIVRETSRQVTDGKYLFCSADGSVAMTDDHYSVTDCVCSTLSGLSGCDDPCPDLNGCF